MESADERRKQKQEKRAAKRAAKQAARANLEIVYRETQKPGMPPRPAIDETPGLDRPDGPEEGFQEFKEINPQHRERPQERAKESTIEKPFKYHYLKYNHDGVLRPNWPLRLSLIFLCRHILMIVLIGGMSFKGGINPDMKIFLNMLEPAYFFTDVPGVMMLYVMLARRPNAGPAVRWIWRHGRQLILLSVTLFLILFAIRTRLDIAAYETAEWTIIGANMIVAVYIATSGYIRDLFREFPERPETEAGD